MVDFGQGKVDVEYFQMNIFSPHRFSPFDVVFGICFGKRSVFEKVYPSRLASMLILSPDLGDETRLLIDAFGQRLRIFGQGCTKLVGWETKINL